MDKYLAHLAHIATSMAIAAIYADGRDLEDLSEDEKARYADRAVAEVMAADELPTT